jgi:hypothetical protein
LIDFRESFIYNALVCEMPHIADQECERIVIGPTEYSVQGFQKTLTFQNMTYNFTSYEFSDTGNRTVAICIPESFTEPKVINLLICLLI